MALPSQAFGDVQRFLKQRRAGGQIVSPHSERLAWQAYWDAQASRQSESRRIGLAEDELDWRKDATKEAADRAQDAAKIAGITEIGTLGVGAATLLKGTKAGGFIGLGKSTTSAVPKSLGVAPGVGTTSAPTPAGAELGHIAAAGPFGASAAAPLPGHLTAGYVGAPGGQAVGLVGGEAAGGAGAAGAVGGTAALGIAGASAVGGLAGSTIGGKVAGDKGNVAGGVAAGVGTGFVVGASYGSVGGPIGALIGGVVGGLIGSVQGSKGGEGTSLSPEELASRRETQGKRNALLETKRVASFETARSAGGRDFVDSLGNWGPAR
jgi:hypothetical protein